MVVENKSQPITIPPGAFEAAIRREDGFEIDVRSGSDEEGGTSPNDEVVDTGQFRVESGTDSEINSG